MKNSELSIHPDDFLSTNEMIHDYSFWYQMVCEGRKMDFEASFSYAGNEILK
jgi:hypothetical protein